MSRGIGTPIEKFWRYIEKSNEGCWIWIGRVDSKGYGRTDLMGEHNGFAHRLAYKVLVGQIPSGTEFDHVCHTQALKLGLCQGGNDCIHRRCVNPAHLEPVTHTINVRRGNSPSAIHSQKLTCPLGHDYTQILNERGKPKRICLTCRTDRNVRNWADPLFRERERERRKSRAVAKEIESL